MPSQRWFCSHLTGSALRAVHESETGLSESLRVPSPFPAGAPVPRLGSGPDTGRTSVVTCEAQAGSVAGKAGPVAVIMRTVGPLGIDFNHLVPMKPFRFVFRDRRSHASIPPRQQYDSPCQYHFRNLKWDRSVLYMCDKSVNHQNPCSTMSSPQACLLYPRAAW